MKKQMEVATDPPQSIRPAFVELPTPVMVGKQGLFELNNGAGATMRIQLVGYDAAEIEILACSFWKR
ncbi:MAG: hypothetical protein ABI645_16415 [Pseudomonadota bacterium]